MPFQLDNCLQSQQFFAGVQGSMFNSVHQISKKTGWIRAVAPAIAVSSSVLTLSTIVAAVGEATIKGLTNLFGSPFVKECKASKGCQQLFIFLPTHTLSLLFAPITIGIVTAINTIAMLSFPEKYSKKMKSEYEKIQEKNQAKSIEAIVKPIKDFRDQIEEIFMYRESEIDLPFDVMYS